jgi:hypothetical protein
MAAGAVLGLLLSACGSTDSPSPDASGVVTASSLPSATADATRTTPPSAAYDPASILLRFDAIPDSVTDPFGDPQMDGIGGNLWYVPGPDFTLYGDGTVIFRDDEAARANSRMDGRSFIGQPLSIAHLTADQVEEVLDHAWQEGGLSEAKAQYPTSAVDLVISGTFTISAHERRRDVQLHGLFPNEGGADAADIARLVGLADYLRHLDKAMGIEAQQWTPERYWASLSLVDTSFVGSPSDEWPWDHIGLEGWVGGRRSLTPSEVEALGIGPVPGGYCCHLISGPGGDDPPYTAYGLAIWPMLPEPIRTDAVAEVVTNDLVVRTAPGTDASTSQILTPALNAPQLLYVVDGPVAADGHDWYLVQPFAGYPVPNPPEPSGWLAAGGQDGEPWVAPARLACPPADDLYAISHVSDLTRLACYGSERLVLGGTFDGCSTRDPVTVSPDSLAHAVCTLLPDPYDPDVVPGLRPLVIWVDDAPGGIERGQLVRVEGHFDDPVAQRCTSESGVGPVQIPELVVLACRTQFFATAITVP